jgi:hypothetical protein
MKNKNFLLSRKNSRNNFSAESIVLHILSFIFMISLKKISFRLLTAVFCLCTLHAQESAESEAAKKMNRFSLMIGAAAGNFEISEPKFTTIYSNRSVSRIYFAGIGTNAIYLVGKYREFSATGKSIVENVTVTGQSDWKQKFYCVGLRIHSDDHPLYAEILYVLTRIEESITTKDLVVQELTAKEEAENKGAGFSAGISLKLAGPFRIFVEGEYDIMMRKDRNQYGRANPELGGFCVSAGAQFAL